MVARRTPPLPMLRLPSLSRAHSASLRSTCPMVVQFERRAKKADRQARRAQVRKIVLHTPLPRLFDKHELSDVTTDRSNVFLLTVQLPAPSCPQSSMCMPRKVGGLSALNDGEGWASAGSAEHVSSASKRCAHRLSLASLGCVLAAPRDRARPATPCIESEDEMYDGDGSANDGKRGDLACSVTLCLPLQPPCWLSPSLSL